MADARIDELKALLPQAMLPDWVRLGARAVRLFRDRHHPDKHELLLTRLLEQVRASVALREARRLNVPQVSYPPDLPITARKDEIVAAIRAHQVVVLSGETGSGKTTQIPKMCLEAGLGVAAKIGCTQPRRVAALSISRRIAEELNVDWGRDVGCKIRFDDHSSPHTHIKLMTDGILLAETQGDPDLSEYDALILDEAHERSLNIDFLLGHLKTLLARRHDLKLIVTSATIDTQMFARHFNDAPIIEVSGRVYPVEVVYAPFMGEEEAEDFSPPDRAGASANRDKGQEWESSVAVTPESAPTAEATSPFAAEADHLALTLRAQLQSLGAAADLTYVDAAVQTAEHILYATNFGDMLIFLPGERDIREAADQLEGRFGSGAEVIPLFGRLSAGDQQRVFAPSPRRKMVIATNIAETSLTIPGIRYVIDAGLARLSRYNPRTRTRRLPIEPISQSSANQRKGRAGRVEDGICIRLYSEEDFNGRPAFTQPEIQRSNLAEVILRMKAFHLGEIETFPFVQPPSPAAIANGYTLLQELGALDPQRELTPLGRDLARLPIDPTLGRMLLQSQHEHAPRELLIIAAGLSIQDPRERPLDQRDAAAAAHKRFVDPQSDFLTLLNIWNAVHDQWEKLRTQGQRRKFCKQHFLSYLRMREWQDLYAQLHDALDDLGTLRLNESNAAYDAIHRSILSGLIGHVARREERNSYKAAGNRVVTLFPGSALFERGERPGKGRAVRPDANAPKPKSNQPPWVVAGEIVETSQLFARTLAGIDPQWIFQLAPHCCKVTHTHPHWSAGSGRVLVEEIITLHGLEVQRRKAAYGTIDPKDATAIFIRSALVEENIAPPRSRRPGDAESDSDEAPELPAQYRFLAHNRAVRQKIENWQTRVRRHHLADVDQTLTEFYSQRIENVSSRDELNRLLRDQPDQAFLCISEAELAGGQSLAYDAEAFPNAVALGDQPVALTYAYAPGEAHDGVTVRLPFTLAQSVSSGMLEWAVPGLREEKVSELLRALPKAIRKELMPFPPKVAEIVREFRPTGPSFLQDLGRFLHRHYGVEVPASAWPPDALPAHLCTRIEIVGHDQKTIDTGRDLDALRQRLKEQPVNAGRAAESPAWRQALTQWERFGVNGWTFGDLPERITVSEGPGLPLYAWPGVAFEDGSVNVRLFRSVDLARDASITGVQRLIELAIQRDLAWLERDLRALVRYEALHAPLGDLEQLKETALEHLKRHVLPTAPLPALTGAHFQAAVEESRRKLPGLVQQLMDRVGLILQLRQQVQQRIGAVTAPAPPRAQTLSSFSQLAVPAPAPKAANPLAGELAALVPPRFLARVSFDRLVHLPRYLKALLTRAERARLNPPKDQERARQLAPYVEALKKLEAQPPFSTAGRQQVEEFRWMIEEFKVSLFAQELGTAVPVSPKRLDEQLARAREA